MEGLAKNELVLIQNHKKQCLHCLDAREDLSNLHNIPYPFPPYNAPPNPKNAGVGTVGCHLLYLKKEPNARTFQPPAVCCTHRGTLHVLSRLYKPRSSRDVKKDVSKNMSVVKI